MILSFDKKTYKIFFYCCSLLILPINESKGQYNDSAYFKRNSLYVEFSTDIPYYSINYERILHSRLNNLNGRIGFSILDNYIAFPLGISFFTGKGNSHAEYSFSIIPYIEEYKYFFSNRDMADTYVFIEPCMGYRFQKPRGSFCFKISVSPAILLDPSSEDFWDMNPQLKPVLNYGIGFCFGKK